MLFLAVAAGGKMDEILAQGEGIALSIHVRFQVHECTRRQLMSS